MTNSRTDYEGLSAAKLKVACADRGLTKTGDKGTLIWRLELKDRAAGVVLPDGRDPFSLKGAELKKQAARAGASPIGSVDEILDGLVTALMAAAPPKPVEESVDATDTDYESMSAAKLKVVCADRGLTKTGDKGTLIWRLELKDRAAGVVLPDGSDPFSLKGAELKKQAARAGVSPIGSVDEILEGLVKALMAAAPPRPVVESNGTKAKGAGNGDARTIAGKVLEMAERDDWEGILCLGAGGKVLTSSSPTNDLKKAYRRLSLVIHPDKLRGFDGATKAFQALVTALDRITNPEPPAAEGPVGKGKKGKKACRIERTNDGCERTDVACPRCGESWGARPVEGLPLYAYNFMMTGLRTYTCSTCLCAFGCVSAAHSCGKCGKDFDYSPADYHRKIECEGCGTKFGFWSFHVSDRAMNDALKEARLKFEANAKSRASKQRRSKSRNRQDAPPSAADAERLFILGLTDECPRCGAFHGKGTSRDDKREHLADCDDKTAHNQHKSRAGKKAARSRGLDDEEEKMEAVQAKATWEASGSHTSTLWMLPDACLIEMAGDDDDARSCSRAELIARAAASRDGVLLLTDGDSLAPKRQAKRRKLNAESLPSNYASLSADDLRNICAAHGFIPKGGTKDAVLTEIENELHGDKGVTTLMLTAGKDDDGDGKDGDFCYDVTYSDDDE